MQWGPCLGDGIHDGKKKTITFLQKRSASLIFQVSPHPFGLLFLPSGWKSFLAELPLTQRASCPVPVCVLVKRAVECERWLYLNTPFTDIHWPSPCFIRKRLIPVMISWLLFYEAIQLGGCPHRPTTLSLLLLLLYLSWIYLDFSIRQNSKATSTPPWSCLTSILCGLPSVWAVLPQDNEHPKERSLPLMLKAS